MSDDVKARLRAWLAGRGSTCDDWDKLMRDALAALEAAEAERDDARGIADAFMHAGDEDFNARMECGHHPSHERSVDGEQSDGTPASGEWCEVCAERDQLRARVADYENSIKHAMDETCGDEKHCACVPLLRARVAELESRS